VDGGQPFAFAGLWEWWRAPDDKDGTGLESCTLLTTEPNELQSTLHDRMPVILDPLNYDPWLDPANDDRDRLQAMLTAFPSDRMTVRPVNTLVNNARNEGSECLNPPG
jgi:putative SOS response-associated peptidase YedK